LPKIGALRQQINALGLQIELEVDGGVKVDNIEQIAAAGADVFVAGGAGFGADNYQSTISQLKNNGAKGQICYA
jgi:ribulose-phosphate 3-epimerase